MVSWNYILIAFIFNILLKMPKNSCGIHFIYILYICNNIVFFGYRKLERRPIYRWLPSNINMTSNKFVVHRVSTPWLNFSNLGQQLVYDPNGLIFKDEITENNNYKSRSETEMDEFFIKNYTYHLFTRFIFFAARHHTLVNF